MQGGVAGRDETRENQAMWEPSELVELASSALRARERELSAEQAVYGLDSLDEVGLHPPLASGFAQGGFGVRREHPYPGIVRDRAKGPERERCDLVLTLDPALDLLDPVEELKQIDAATGTLFAPLASSIAAEREGVEVGEAYWVEVKTIAQHAYVSGVPVPNRAYATELVAGPSADAVKIARDPMVRQGGVLVVLFTEDELIAEHDIGAMAHRCLDTGAPVGSPSWVSFPIEERAGNAVCTVAILPVRL